jgi:hypothetical protein
MGPTTRSRGAGSWSQARLKIIEAEKGPPEIIREVIATVRAIAHLTIRVISVCPVPVRTTAFRLGLEPALRSGKTFAGTVITATKPETPCRFAPN